MIAWQETPTTGSAQIVASWAPKGAQGGRPRPPVGVSAAANGPTDASLGLFAGGDDNGDAVVAWVQGTAGALSIEAAELVARPGRTAGRRPLFYTDRRTPTLSWPAAVQPWGALSYAVTVDGSVLGETGRLELEARQTTARRPPRVVVDRDQRSLEVGDRIPADGVRRHLSAGSARTSERQAQGW